MITLDAEQHVADSRVRKLHSLFKAGVIPGPKEHEVHPDLPRASRANYLYFTLTPSLNFQRNSPALWRSALDTFLDPDTSYLFVPSEVVAREPGEVAHDLARHRLAIQTNRHPKIWSGLCQTLHTHYDGDPRNLLSSGQHSVRALTQLLQVVHRDRFPGLRGPKLSNYWLFIISQFTDAQFPDISELSIIPDTHVIQATVRLGLASEHATPEAVAALWRDVLNRLSLSPVDMHSALWRWSRNNFTPDL